ncbi:(Fe-S)-binding protein [Lysobacter antibioticus]|uniref:(Fe-S)-binding protein n=1 Tax=Lysobacter antibioticus TaxID=84531 RepID=UPI00165155DA|nr:(Fe-S)-binding protein [Lysobacter antibioticus]
MSHDRSPPSADPLVALADRCVQCGLCLPSCPTYGRDRLEAESPRGRIALARAWALDSIAPTPTSDAHLDHCLGCHSCESVCPAGVDYGRLLVLARTRQRDRRPPVWRQRLIEGLAARPRWLAAALSLYRIGHPWLPEAWRSLPRPPRRLPMPATRPQAAAQARAGLFVGCVAGSYESAVRAATVRLCASLGVELDPVAGQGCCGALHEHAGNAAAAQDLAQANRSAFSAHTTVLSLASGCHTALAHSLAPQAQVIDAIAYLDQAGAGLRFRPSQQRIAVHLPCTQRNVVKSVPALRRLLARVPGLQVVELDAGYGCCGAAGSQMLTDPARAAEYRAPLLEQLAHSGASLLLSANIGCRLHLGGGTAIPVQHPLEFLAGLLDDGASEPAVD